MLTLSRSLTASLIVLAVVAFIRGGEPRLVALNGDIAVAGEIAESEVLAIAGEFSAVLEAVKQLDPAGKFRQPVPIRILAVKGKDAALPRVGDSFGVIGPFSYLIVFDSDNESSRRRARTLLAARLLDNEFGTSAIPAWLRSGVTEIFGSLRRSGSAAVFHSDPERISGTVPSSDTVLSTDHVALSSQTRSTSVGFRFAARNLSAAVLDSGPEKFRALLKAFEDGKPAELALNQVYGFGAAEIDSKSKLAAPVRIQLGPELPLLARAPFGQKELLEWKLEVLLGIGRVADAVNLVRVGPETTGMRVLAGIAAARNGDRATSARFFDEALKAAPSDFRPYFARAAMLLDDETTEIGQSSGFSEQTASAARPDLLKAIELKPEFVPAYEKLALLNSVRNENVIRTIDLLKSAVAISPGNFWLRMRMAELQAAARNFDQALAAVSGLRRAAPGPIELVYAESTIRRLISLKYQLASLRRGTGDVDGITDSPLSDEEIARRRALALNESLNQALRIPLENERRLLGIIEKIDCGRNGASISVRSGTGLVKLRAESVESVVLTSFVEKFVNSEFGCSAKPPFGPAVVTFRPVAVDGFAGNLIAVEFVPQSFRFLENTRGTTF